MHVIILLFEVYVTLFLGSEVHCARSRDRRDPIYPALGTLRVGLALRRQARYKDWGFTPG